MNSNQMQKSQTSELIHSLRLYFNLDMMLWFSMF